MKTLAAALIVATMLTAPAMAQITLSVCDKEGCDVGKTGVYSPPSPRPLANPVAGDEWISNGHRWKRLGDRDVDLGELPHPEHPVMNLDTADHATAGLMSTTATEGHTFCDTHNPDNCVLLPPNWHIPTIAIGTCQSLSPEAIKQIKDALR